MGWGTLLDKIRTATISSAAIATIGAAQEAHAQLQPITEAQRQRACEKHSIDIQSPTILKQNGKHEVYIRAPCSNDIEVRFTDTNQLTPRPDTSTANDELVTSIPEQWIRIPELFEQATILVRVHYNNQVETRRVIVTREAQFTLQVSAGAELQNGFNNVASNTTKTNWIDRAPALNVTVATLIGQNGYIHMQAARASRLSSNASVYAGYPLSSLLGSIHGQQGTGSQSFGILMYGALQKRQVPDLEPLTEARLSIGPGIVGRGFLASYQWGLKSQAGSIMPSARVKTTAARIVANGNFFHIHENIMFSAAREWSNSPADRYQGNNDHAYITMAPFSRFNMLSFSIGASNEGTKWRTGNEAGQRRLIEPRFGVSYTQFFGHHPYRK
jgi:hypothetical protein